MEKYFEHYKETSLKVLPFKDELYTCWLIGNGLKTIGDLCLFLGEGNHLTREGMRIEDYHVASFFEELYETNKEKDFGDPETYSLELAFLELEKIYMSVRTEHYLSGKKKWFVFGELAKTLKEDSKAFKSAGAKTCRELEDIVNFHLLSKGAGSLKEVDRREGSSELFWSSVDLETCYALEQEGIKTLYDFAHSDLRRVAKNTGLNYSFLKSSLHQARITSAYDDDAKGTYDDYLIDEDNFIRKGNQLFNKMDGKHLLDAPLETLQFSKNISKHLAKSNFKTLSSVFDVGFLRFAKSLFLFDCDYEQLLIEFKEAVKFEVLKDLETRVLDSFSFGAVEGQDFNTLISSWNFDCSQEEVKNAVNSLVSKGLLIEEENILKKKPIPFIDFLNMQQDSQKKELLLGHLEGKTLHEIGDPLSLTRERIRQIITLYFRSLINRASAMSTTFIEDKYKYVFETYELSQKEFLDIFQESIFTLEYLRMRYKSGSKNVKEIQYDEDIDKEIAEKISEYTDRNMLIINGEKLKRNGMSLVNYVIKNRCTNDVTCEEFERVFLDFLKENGLENDEKLLHTYKGMKNRISELDNIVCKRHFTFRYYDYSKYDFSNFAEKLGCDERWGAILSTEVLFNDNAGLMVDYDIHDYYELHSILKRLYKYDSDTIIIVKRMPRIEIGQVDSKEFTVRKWREYGEPAVSDFSKRLSDEIGFSSMFVYNEFINKSDVPLLIKQKNMMDPLPFDVREKVKSYLSKDFYFYDEFIATCLAIDVDLTDKLDYGNAELLGYNLFSDYLIKQPYNAKEYFEKLMSESDVIYYDDYKRLFGCNTFGGLFRIAKKNLDIIETQKGIYKKLPAVIEERNATRESLFKMAEDAVKFADDQYIMFFTVKQLIDKGLFENEGFDMTDATLLESLIEYHCHLPATSVFANKVFCLLKEPFSMKDLIWFIIRMRGSMSVKEVDAYLNEEFGIKQRDNHKVREILGSSLFEFNQETSKYSIAD